MRGTLLVVAACAVVVLVPAVQANEKPTEAYQKIMQDLNDANQALRTDAKAIESAGAYPDYKTFSKDAAMLKAAFSATLEFWSARKADDAVKLVQTGLKGVADVEAAAKDKNYDDLTMAVTVVGGTCTACHANHREKLPDGTYEIK